MNSNLFITLAISSLFSVALSSPLTFVPKCIPGDNCKMPECRCWDDDSLPGNITIKKTPQMILITFDYSFNPHTVTQYKKLFSSLKNPNSCDAKGTFFIQAYGSHNQTLKELYLDKHELAINSERGIIPTSEKEWTENINSVKKLAQVAGIPADQIKGLRAPQLASGGDDEFEVMKGHGLTYDSSCITVDYSEPKKLLWPYTMDFVDNLPYCSAGKSVKRGFPGIWEVPVPVLSYEGLQCPTPAGCIPKINKTDDVFRMFYNAFDSHYYNNKAPMILDIDPQWVTEDFRVMGTKQFLELIGAYEDTWILTVSQALAWMKDPKPKEELLEYAPWGC